MEDEYQVFHGWKWLFQIFVIWLIIVINCAGFLWLIDLSANSGG